MSLKDVFSLLLGYFIIYAYAVVDDADFKG